jgi:hypothetical protein
MEQAASSGEFLFRLVSHGSLLQFESRSGEESRRGCRRGAEIPYKQGTSAANHAAKWYLCPFFPWCFDNFSSSDHLSTRIAAPSGSTSSAPGSTQF